MTRSDAQQKAGSILNRIYTTIIAISNQVNQSEY